MALKDIKERVSKTYADLMARKPYTDVTYNFGKTASLQEAKVSNLKEAVTTDDDYNLVLNRTAVSDGCMTGTLHLYKGETELAAYDSVEQVWKDNTPGESCIPNGTYTVKMSNPTTSIAYKHIIVEGTDPRSNIVIKKNDGSSLSNCIAIGTSKKDIVPTEKTIWDALLKELGSPIAAAGFMGNLQAESSLKSNNLEGKYEKEFGMTDTSYTEGVNDGTYTDFVDDHAGYGLAQWTYHARKKALLDYAEQQGKPIEDLQMQLEFLFTETEYKNIKKDLISASTVREASDIVMLRYEKPADQSEAKQEKRAKMGQAFYNKYASDSLVTLLFSSGNENESYILQINNKTNQSIPTQESIVADKVKNLPTSLFITAANEAENKSNEKMVRTVISKLPPEENTDKAKSIILEAAREKQVSVMPTTAALPESASIATSLPESTSILTSLPESTSATTSLPESTATILSESIVSGSTKTTSRKKVISLLDKIQNNPITKNLKKWQTEPEDIIYDKAINWANNIFLSKNPNDYVAAMMGISQNYLQDKVDTLQRDMASLTAYISDYIAWMIAEIEDYMRVKTFPNLLRLLKEMEEKLLQLVQQTASLQSRLIKEWNYSGKRLNNIDENIYEILKRNNKVRRALAWYNPNAKLDLDLNGLIRYVKEEAKRIIKSITNLKDFPKKFKATVNPKEIFYKNFSRLYTYLEKAMRANTSSIQNWKGSKLELLKSNCSIVSENMYKISTIIEKYRYSNAMIGEEESSSSNKLLPALNEFIEGLGSINTSYFSTLIAEVEYVVASVLKQAEILAKTPYNTLMAEIEARKDYGLDTIKEFLGIDWVFNQGGIVLDSSINPLTDLVDDPFVDLVTDLAAENESGQEVNENDSEQKVNENGSGQKVNPYNYLRNVIGNSMRNKIEKKLMSKFDKISLQILPTVKGKSLIDTLSNLNNRIKNACEDVQDTLDGVSNLLNIFGEKVKPEIAPEVIEETKIITEASSSINTAIEEADPEKLVEAVEKPSKVTESGGKAEELKEAAAEVKKEIEEGSADSSVTYRVVDALNRATALFEGDHKKECKEKVIAAEGLGGRLYIDVINDYRTSVYDNAVKIMNWLNEWLKTVPEKQEE